MEYGCIGEKLGHSFSKEIHNMLGNYRYELCELGRNELSEFMKRADFKAINVTIPYKEAVIPYLYCIDEGARSIGAVNTVVNRGGKLYGYNTDFYGASMLIRHAGIEIKGKKVAILGTGGTSKTLCAVVKSLGAKEVLTVSRTPKGTEISYGEFVGAHRDTQIIVNTTPLGMYPKICDSAVDIGLFPGLTGVIDAVYNPLRSELVSAALDGGIPAEGGLYMLVAQAVMASEIFLGTKYPEGTLDRIYEKVLKEKEAIVLTGMPASGKSTVGAILKERLGLEFIDTDALIVEKVGMSIAEYFKKYGEAEFRERESEIIREVAGVGGRIIATGGGAVLRSENIKNLKKNGKIFFIDRPLSALLPTSDRPLASDRAAIEKCYAQRYEIYKSTADRVIDADCDALSVAKKIEVAR